MLYQMGTIKTRKTVKDLNNRTNLTFRMEILKMIPKMFKYKQLHSNIIMAFSRHYTSTKFIYLATCYDLFVLKINFP